MPWPVIRSRLRCVLGVAVSTVVVSWFPNNLARNSLARLSNIEIESLVLQRLWRLLNCQANELRAKFLTRGLGGAGSGLPRRFEHLATGRWSPKVSEKVRAWRGELYIARVALLTHV